MIDVTGACGIVGYWRWKACELDLGITLGLGKELEDIRSFSHCASLIIPGVVAFNFLYT